MRLKKYLLLSAFAYMCCCLYAQTTSKTINDSEVLTCFQCDSLSNRICLETVYGHPENLAQFPGGPIELMNFITKNFQYPEECKKEAIQGRVVVKFIIIESGKIICPYIQKSIHPALDKEALRIVKLMPDWEPASNNEVPCKTCFTLPITFKL
jgi:TonB family protein